MISIFRPFRVEHPKFVVRVRICREQPRNARAWGQMQASNVLGRKRRELEWRCKSDECAFV